ncbi:MAG: chemotaxis protein CheD [Alphaproteobacteria bacterium]|nr:chemotaxis protein CheD [Alphaproteobacteria bacterium]
MNEGFPHSHQLPLIHLFPGEIACRPEPQLISTILGSCVAVCLWDRNLRFGGMNHFLLPRWEHQDEPSPRYGNIAVETLIMEMRRFGSRLVDLRAKIFGGANVLSMASDGPSIGTRNIEMALHELHRFDIPVVNRRVSGTNGVLIKQFTETGEVWVRPVRNGSRVSD